MSAARRHFRIRPDLTVPSPDGIFDAQGCGEPAAGHRMVGPPAETGQPLSDTRETSPPPADPHPPGTWPAARAAARRLISPVERFIATEAFSGILLLAAALVALVWANSPWRSAYDSLLHTAVGIRIGSFAFERDAHFWVNDGLMVVFFFVVGLEIKRELLRGRAQHAAQGRPPRVRRAGRHARSGGHLRPVQCRHAGRRRRRRSDGDRHRVRGRDPRASGKARAARLADPAPRPRRHRRPGRDRRHRAVLFVGDQRRRAGHRRRRDPPHPADAEARFPLAVGVRRFLAS